MTYSINITLGRGNTPEGKPKIVAVIQVDNPALIGKSAVFNLYEEVKVHDSRPVNSSRTLFTKRFVLLEPTTIIDIPADTARAYTYRGASIDILVFTKLTVDDKVLFDTTVKEEQEIDIGAKPAVNTDAAALVEPPDTFNFMANMKAIPPAGRLKIKVLMFIGTIILGINTVIGYHDQFMVSEPTIIYSRVNSDGESQSPIVGALGADGAAGAFLWFLIRNELRKYMKFQFRPGLVKIRRDTRLKVSDIVEGVSRVPLHDVVVRIVACNMECGQYTRGSGTDTRTVSFKNPIRAVLVYSRQIALIPADTPLDSYIDDDMSFRAMYSLLYPPNMPSSSHGINVHWEVQLLHREYVDQELIGDVATFEYSDFMEA